MFLRRRRQANQLCSSRKEPATKYEMNIWRAKITNVVVSLWQTNYYVIVNWSLLKWRCTYINFQRNFCIESNVWECMLASDLQNQLLASRNTYSLSFSNNRTRNIAVNLQRMTCIIILHVHCPGLNHAPAKRLRTASEPRDLFTLFSWSEHGDVLKARVCPPQNPLNLGVL